MVQEKKISQCKLRQAYGWQSHSILALVQCGNKKQRIDGCVMKIKLNAQSRMHREEV